MVAQGCLASQPPIASSPTSTLACDYPKSGWGNDITVQPCTGVMGHPCSVL